MAYLLIVHQPACSNVVAVDGKHGGTATRLYQHTAERCRGYLQALLDQGAERYSDDMRCAAGDCLALDWNVA